MWRHAVNGFNIMSGAGVDFLVIGPLRGGGVLVEIGWIADVGASCTSRYAAALTGSPSATQANLESGNALIHRSNEASGIFASPTVKLPITSAQYCRIVLPLSVRLDGGGQYVIFGINCATGDVELNTLAWALEIGGPGSAGYKGPMRNAGGLGVENGLER